MSQSDNRIEIFPATALADPGALRPVLEDAVRHPETNHLLHDEIDSVIAELTRSFQGQDDRYYAIAQTSGGEVLGMMGLQAPDEEMLRFTWTDHPGELINAYVSKAARGQGVGRSLVTHLEDVARSQGREELVLNSGPRYRDSGWPFWRRMYGKPVGKLTDHYGKGFHAKVWHKSLADKD